MATPSHQQEFYREVDRYRHQRGCWGVGVIILIVVALAVGAYIYLRHLGVL